MRIAIPLLTVTTPLGVVWGVVEAYRFHPWLAGLMVLLLAVIGGFTGMTLRQIRKERAARTPRLPENAHEQQLKSQVDR